MAELTDLWREVEEHLQAFSLHARRTVEEAWLAGDALGRIREQLPHGAWLPALRERGIPVRTAQRFVRLRQQYPQMRQIVAFDSVSAALTGPKVETVEQAAGTAATLYIIAADDYWDWERHEVSPLGRRFLDAVELRTVEWAIRDVLAGYERECGSGPDYERAVAGFRAALGCMVDVGPFVGDQGAMAETERRLEGYVMRACELL